MLRRIILVLALIVVVAASLSAQNPFTRPAEPDRPAASEAARGFRIAVPRFIREWSHQLQNSIAELSRSVGEERDWGAALVAFVLAILFGAVHIVGPGHGKVFALSYFSARDARPVHGLVYSAIVNAVDSISAFVVVMLGYVVLVAVAPAFRLDAPRVLSIVSYSLIVIFGVVHLASHLLPHRHHDHDHDHDHESADHAHPPAHPAGSERPPWVLALSVGLIPCPVSTVLLVYGIVNANLAFMVFMVVGVSLGGFLAMSAISLSVIGGRRQIMSRLSSKGAVVVTMVLEYGSSAIIIALGLLLLLAAL